MSAGQPDNFPQLELISVHVPKCAGQSLGLALREAYGREAVHERNDQLENPASIFNIDPEGFMEVIRNHPMRFLRGKRAVHGHMYIGRFARIAQARRVTVLRDPVERLISHYFYWQDPRPPFGPLRKYVLENKLTPVEFARLPNLRYYYTRIFFRDVDMAVFDYVGNYAQLEASVQKIGQLIGKPLALPHQNRNPIATYETQKQELLNDAAKMSAIRNLLKEDMEFYERWSR